MVRERAGGRYPFLAVEFGPPLPPAAAGWMDWNFVLDAESTPLTNQSLLSQAERSVSTAALALDLSAGRIDMNRLPNSP